MNKYCIQIFLLAVSFCFPMFSIVKPSSYYPAIHKTLEGTMVCKGDRQGNFQGDLMAVLSDGSIWKIHPDSRIEFERWQKGEKLHIAKRSDRYFFKREHHFLLVNHHSHSSIKAMLFRYPKENPLRIISTSGYYKSVRPNLTKEITKTKDDKGKETIKEKDVYVGEVPSDPRKILKLSDGSVWVIRDHLEEFQEGMRICVGAQTMPNRFYDFVLIVGDEREAISVLARPQK